MDGAPSPSRPWGSSIGFGLVWAAAAMCCAIALLALPLFALAAFAEPGSGLDRPFVRTGLVRVAVPAGVVVGLATGIVAARWRRRGGTIPPPDR